MSDASAPPAPPPVRRRERLGAHLTGFERHYVYRLPDGIEIDAVDGYAVSRVRVFFADVLLITLHRQHRRGWLWSTGLATAGFGFIGVLMAIGGGLLAALPFLLCFVLPFLITFLLMCREDVIVTVFGRRTRAVMRWHWRHARAEAVYTDLVVAVREAQAAASARIEAQAAATSPFAAPPTGEGIVPAGGAPAGAPAAAPSPPH